MAGINRFSDPLAKPIRPMSEGDPYRGVLGTFGVPMVARVTGYDFESNERGELQLDENRNPIPTGLLEIELLDRPGTRTKVPYVLPMAGNTMFMGGLPELETLCIVEFRQQNNPVVVGFLPPGLHNLKTQRGQIKVPLPGEILIQASTQSVDDNGDSNFFKGASVKLDRYGRYVVTLGGVGKNDKGEETLEKKYEFVVGYMLSSEYRNDVTWVNEPVTRVPVFMRESILDGQVERRVDRDGNAVFRYGKNVDVAIGGTHNERKVGRWTVTAEQGVVIQDDAGNKVELGQDGKITIKTSGAMDMLANGSQVQAVGGNQDVQVALRRAATIGEDDVVSVAGSLRQEVAQDHELNVALGSSMEDVIAGMKRIHATLGITLETEAIIQLTAMVQAVIDAKIVQVGSGSATEPLVLGTQFSTVFSTLLTVLAAQHALMATGVGLLVPTTGISTEAARTAWAAAHTAAAAACTTTLAQLPLTLSLKCFTEKGP